MKPESEKCSVCKKEIAAGERFYIITKSKWEKSKWCNEHVKTISSEIKCAKCFGVLE